MRRILALGAIALLLCVGLVGCGRTLGVAPSESAGPSAAQAEHNTAPQRVSTTLARIDAGQWPPADGSGTKGGSRFGNFERRLPVTSADGKTVRYTEWDVNVKARNRGRDAERIVTGSDGSAWYTLDHYQSFTRIR